jgi:hypothetical protein
MELGYLLDDVALLIFSDLREHRQGQHLTRGTFRLRQVAFDVAQVPEAFLQV